MLVFPGLSLPLIIYTLRHFNFFLFFSYLRYLSCAFAFSPKILCSFFSFIVHLFGCFQETALRLPEVTYK